MYTTLRGASCQFVGPSPNFEKIFLRGSLVLEKEIEMYKLLPVDLVLLRHAKSEINEAIHRSKQGDHSAYTPELRRRPFSQFRLVEDGLGQVQLARKWILINLYQGSDRFDCYITSPYFRAVETAGNLQLPNARWELNPYLIERGWGDVESTSQRDRDKKYKKVFDVWRRDPLFSKPPNGESFVQLCLRIEQVLDMLRRNYADKRVIIVCHGDVILAFRFILEHILLDRMSEIMRYEIEEDRINNCQIVHYTRRVPGEGRITLDPNRLWTRMVRPTDKPAFVSDWRMIQPAPLYSNEDLLKIVSRAPRIIS